MITLNAPDFYGSCVFCDDLRVEANGKFFYIGVYPSGHMFINAPFPFVIPRLVISISYSQIPEKFISPVFWFFLPGDSEEEPSVRASLPEEAGAAALARVSSSDLPVGKEQIYANVHANFTISNIEIKSQGLLKVRAVRGDELVRLGSLFVRSGSAEAMV